MLTITSAQTTKNGRSSDANRPSTDVSESTPPISGPQTSPRLAVMTTRLMARTFCSSLLHMSMKAAWAIGWLPAVKPEIIRATTSSVRLPTNSDTIVRT